MTDFKFDAWPTEFRTINQYFGVNPQNYAQFGLPGHEGIDFMAPDGSKVFCVAPGTVFATHPDPTGHNYGTHVRVNHIDNYQTVYAHLRQLFVQVGDVVKAGTVLGLADNTGNSFGSHLHLTLKKLDATYLNWPFNITDPTPFVLPLLGWQTPAGPYVDGWAFVPGITLGDGLAQTLAQANAGGINLRSDASIDASLIVLVPAGTIMIVTGPARGQYLPVQVPRAAVGLNGPPPSPDTVLGWAWTQNITVNALQAVIGPAGINLRAAADQNSAKLGLVKEGAVAVVVGPARAAYTPIRARQDDISGLVSPLPAVDPPDPFPPPQPAPGSTPGWAFTSQMTITGPTAVAGQYGLNLRQAPRRDATAIGFIPGNASVAVTGQAQGEYTPVLVDDKVLQPPFGTAPAPTTGPTATPPTPSPAPAPAPNADPQPLGHCFIGLHASADPGIPEAEYQEFTDLRPGIVKVLSFHSDTAIARLAALFPDAIWVVRAFLDFGGRTLSTQDFMNGTLSDVQRALRVLPGKDVVVELHNEPNVVQEGLGKSWTDGGSFATWWLDLLGRYRQALPGVRFIYPGLSPGSTVTGVKLDHVQFAEASRSAIEAADGLGVHLYWSAVAPLPGALDVLDDYISRFRFKPLWVTEASNNKTGATPAQKAQEYIQLWQELQKRATVNGVTYFVASASNPDFAEEVWVGRGIGALVGRR